MDGVARWCGAHSTAAVGFLMRRVFSGQAQPAYVGYPDITMPEDVPAGRRRALAKQAAPLGPRVSVIIPTRDRLGNVEAAIESVLSQSIAPEQIIVVDDGSEDGTWQSVSRQFRSAVETGQLTLVRTEGEGQGAARNHGLRVARGDIIAYLDSDNVWHPDHLLFALGAGIHEGHSFVYSGIHVEHLLDERRSLLAQPFNRAALLRANYIDTSSMVHHRVLIDRWGEWDNRFRRVIDWEFALRLTTVHDAVLIPVVTVDVVVGADSVTVQHDLGPEIEMIDHMYPLERCLTGAARLDYEGFAQLFRSPAETPSNASARTVPAVDLDLGAIRSVPGWNDSVGLAPSVPRHLLIFCGALDIPERLADAHQAVRELAMAHDVIVVCCEDPGPSVADWIAAGATATVNLVGLSTPQERLTAVRRLAATSSGAYLVGRSPWVVERAAELRVMLRDVPMVYEVRDAPGSWMVDFAGNGATLADGVTTFDEHDARQLSVAHRLGANRVAVIRDGATERTEAVLRASKRVHDQLNALANS